MTRSDATGEDTIGEGLEELCRAHDIGPEVVRNGDDVQALLERLLDEYEERLAGRGDAPPEAGEAAGERTPMRGLVRFAAEAAALQEKATAAASLRETNDALRAALAEAESGRRRLERLAETMRVLSTLSHKINNPLTSLMGRAQLLRRYEGVDERVAKAAEVIEESARRLADHVRELARTVKDARQDADDGGDAG